MRNGARGSTGARGVGMPRKSWIVADRFEPWRQCITSGFIVNGRWDIHVKRLGEAGRRPTSAPPRMMDTTNWFLRAQ
jgi:hypothetical protein